VNVATSSWLWRCSLTWLVQPEFVAPCLRSWVYLELWKIEILDMALKFTKANLAKVPQAGVGCRRRRRRQQRNFHATTFAHCAVKRTKLFG
jgi:hypothetical protein